MTTTRARADAPLTADVMVEAVAAALRNSLYPQMLPAPPWQDEVHHEHYRHQARAALAAVAQAGLMRDPDSGQFVAINTLAMTGRHLRDLDAEDMAEACERAASLLRALAEVSR